MSAVAGRGAAETPLACMTVGIELFGATHIASIAVACFLACFPACLASGHSGISLPQRVAVPKSGRAPLPPDVSLLRVRELHSARPVPVMPRRTPRAAGGFFRPSSA